MPAACAGEIETGAIEKSTKTAKTGIVVRKECMKGFLLCG
jgi:hypothetical protein